MLILVVTAAIVGAALVTVLFGVFLWRLVRGGRSKPEAGRPDKTVDREFRKIARRIGKLDPPED